MSPVPLDPPVPPAGSPVDEEEPVVAVEVEASPAPAPLVLGPALVPVNEEVVVEVDDTLPPAPPEPPASGSSPLQAPSSNAVTHERKPNVR
ncbi:MULTISPECIES: hypothetical protein [Sorangium]|uniref:hypothetical protein n=1 Tax=Sorangium TaxID=39643 RepID=UPI001E5B99E0|nr:hypothetical protein [Sorangium cellulosum]